MNKHDMDNLEYIRSLNEEQFDAWSESLSLDDLQYAIDLLKAARTELTLQELELTDEVEDVSMAAGVLAKVMRK